jgi:hypothetical protein
MRLGLPADHAPVAWVHNIPTTGGAMMYKHRLLATLALAWFAALSFSAHAQLADKKALTLDAAKKMAAAAEAEAVKNKWNVVIAIVDDGGHLLYLQRMDGTQTGSIDGPSARPEPRWPSSGPPKYSMTSPRRVHRSSASVPKLSFSKVGCRSIQVSR